jgi:AAA15 family ATPase/GTPase
MLIEFTFSNFRSFKDPTTLSLLAANIKSDPKSVDENNLIHVSKDLDLLTSAVVFGANASGKSNLVRALGFMCNLVLNSSRESREDEPIDVEHFRLSTQTEGQPARFEVIFLIKKQKYRYGFEVTRKRVVSEWLFSTPTTREAKLFTREGKAIQINPRSFREGRGLEERTRPNALFLSVVAQFNGPVARQVQAWFRRLGIISGLDDTSFKGLTLNEFIQNTDHREGIKRFVCALDVGIEDILGEKIDPAEVSFPPGLPEEFKTSLLKDPGFLVNIRTQHKKYDADGNLVGVESFDLDENESEGTKKLFYLTGPIMDTLANGRVLFIDEMETRMHPLITMAFIRLFNSPESNPRRAQLVFTTHDTNLLDRSLFRRDQVWFTEKDRFGATHLYSLVEFRLRNDASFEKDYLRGRYGAVPYPGDLAASFQPTLSVREEGEEYDT